MDDSNVSRIGVGVIIKKGNLVLLGKRKNSHEAGTWSFPGGRLEFGERVADCATREVSEETGIAIKNLKMETFTEDISRDEGRHYVTLFVSADYESGEPRGLEPDKCEKWEWFEWGSLPEPLFPQIKNLIKQGFTLG